MDADTNFFKVFGLPLCWQIDLKVLKEKHRSLQKDFHPDLFVNSSEVEKQRSVEKASVINEGFRVLCSPLSRAQHLLELHGCNANDENAISSDTSFLMKQLEYRELLAKIPESENPLAKVEAFRDKIEHEYVSLQQLFASMIQKQQLEDAKITFSKMQFFSKLLDQISLTEQKIEDF